jgi:hypothetical protein
MTTENDILDPKINASANINDPTYPGPDGKMFQKKPYAIPRPDQATQSSLRFRELRASEILDLPPSYKMRKVKIIATPEDTEEPRGKNKIWTEDPGGTLRRRG